MQRLYNVVTDFTNKKRGFMPTLILSNRYSQDSNLLWNKAIQLGWGIERFISWKIPDDFDPYLPVVLYGEPLFNEIVASQLNLTMIFPANDFLTKLPYWAVRRTIKIISMRELRSLKGPLFVKPLNYKGFPAGIYKPYFGLLDYVANDEMVLVSDVVEWGIEFRFFILDRKIMTYSSYLINGKLSKEESAWGDQWRTDKGAEEEIVYLVNKVLVDNSIELPKTLVLDAGYITGYGPAIIEANAAQSSGIYGCDPEKVLETLKHTIDNDRKN
jgi:hypothetical protein